MKKRRMKRTKKKKKEGTSPMSSPKPPDFSLFLSFSFSFSLFPSSQNTKLYYVAIPPEIQYTASFLFPRLPKNNTNTFKIISEANLTGFRVVVNRKPNLFLFQRVQEILTLQITFFVVIASAFECHAQKKKTEFNTKFPHACTKKFKPSKSSHCEVISGIVKVNTVSQHTVAGSG